MWPFSTKKEKKVTAKPGTATGTAQPFSADERRLQLQERMKKQRSILDEMDEALGTPSKKKKKVAAPSK